MSESTDLVPMPLPVQYTEDNRCMVDLDEWRDVIRKMSMEDMARLAAMGVPSLKAMIKTFQDELIGRLKMAGKTQLAVLRNDGVPDGRVVKLSTTRKYAKDNDGLKAAQEMFHEAGRKDVAVVWEELKSTKVPSIKKVVNSVGENDSQELKDAAEAMLSCVEETSSYTKIKIEAGKDPSVADRISGIQTEVLEEGKNTW